MTYYYDEDHFNEAHDNEVQDNEDNKGKNGNDTNNNEIINESILLEISERTSSQQEKDKNKPLDNNLSINSFGSLNKKNYSVIDINNNLKSKSRFRNLTNTTHNSSNQEEQNSKNPLMNRKSSIRKRHLRSNSSVSNFVLKRTNQIKKKRSNSKLNEVTFHEEISGFALMNFHLEMNDNIIRLIALSISINECRMYDDIKEYKKYYNSTIPWENKDFYKERTLFKEYNEKNIPIWFGHKDDIKMNNIKFKILSFSPFVFHHIRLIDNISIDDILASLDPINNIKYL